MRKLNNWQKCFEAVWKKKALSLKILVYKNFALLFWNRIQFEIT